MKITYFPYRDTHVIYFDIYDDGLISRFKYGGFSNILECIMGINTLKREIVLNYLYNLNIHPKII